MMGTASNWLDRVSVTFQAIDRAWKAAPSPAQLYPPQQNVQTGYLTFPGWDRVTADAGGQDEQRVRKATQSPSVFANMRAIASEFASSELIVKERIGTKLEDVENHPLELLWEAPNPDMGRSFLMAFWAWSYTMAAKSYLYWLPAAGSLQEVWPIPPFMISPVPAVKEFIGGYAFRSGPQATPILIPRDLITYSRSPNLFDIRDGLSFLVAGMTPVESEIAMGFWNRNFFDENNGIPDGVIALGKDTLDTDVARVRQELRDFFGGTKRGVGVARETDMKYIPWGRSQKDAEFVEGIKLASTQIGRLMGFPDGYWSESANRANAEQARATMIAGAVWPLLVALHEDMNSGIVRRWYGDQYRAEFRDIRPEDRELKIKEQEARKTHWTVNELREADGKDPLDDPRGAMLIAEIGKGTPITGTPAGEMTEEFIQKQEDEVAALEAEANISEGGDAAPVEETTEEGVPAEEDGMPMKAAPRYEVPQFVKDLAAAYPDDPLLNGTGKNPPKGGLPVGPVVRDDSFESPQALHLAQWERKAIKSLKRGKGAAVAFESNFIPPDTQERISIALKAAQTVEEVKAAFYAPKTALGQKLWSTRQEGIANGQPLLTKDEIKAAGDDPISGEWDAAVDWARQVME